MQEGVYSLVTIKAQGYDLSVVFIIGFLSDHKLFLGVVELDESTIFNLAMHFTRLEALLFSFNPQENLPFLSIVDVKWPEITEIASLPLKS